uniref:Uncharacterized protein n=1 Tax=Arundo donax TaxID=35708 RepID=A0A0A9ANG1_ARUDO
MDTCLLPSFERFIKHLTTQSITLIRNFLRLSFSHLKWSFVFFCW